jgi:hypothetical protein
MSFVGGGISLGAGESPVTPTLIYRKIIPRDRG